jgi:type II secretory pathway predicted ATPase ExeA
MEDISASLGNRAFGELADPALIVAYQSHQEAIRFLSAEIAKPNGVVLLQGPKGSGKTTIVNEQMDWSSRDAAVALLDGDQLTPRDLTAGMLTQFDVQTVSDRDDSLLPALSGFLAQQTEEGPPPIVILDNADRATPSALRLLNWFAALDVRGKYSLRIILTARDRLATLLKNDALRNLARRKPTIFSLNPLTSRESVIYLRARLIAAGGTQSEKTFSLDVCENLRAMSRGWPGALNDLAYESLEHRHELWVAGRVPRVIVSRDGVNTAEFELSERQYIIGRTEFADIVVDDKYVSKMHAMLRVYSNAVVLLDLKSTNGTTVNSITIDKTILRNNDIITLGHFRLKIENVPAISPEVNDRIKASDTFTLQHLADIRRTRARRAIRALEDP